MQTLPNGIYDRIFVTVFYSTLKNIYYSVK